MWGWAGPVAAVVWLLAVFGFGMRLEGYDQLRHPVSLLGAHGVPGGTAFSMLGFVLPGILAAAAALDLALRMPVTAPRALRVGGQMLLLAAVAFAAMGLLPLDVEDIENRASQYHASAWLLWLVGFSAGALALRLGSARDAAWRPLANLAVGCALWSLCSAFLFEIALPVAMAQRLAFLGWLVWLLGAARLAPARG
ncbi:DUF998 domain-containing protein [Stenotrophomonas sp. ATCM1_4]|uniref:DUF998 domain-containing protein n=1 Tax=Stenotrophomonas sp. ATCM1_4 TaxID=2259330 RepID=UPI00104BE345|nr:DUF998 domain-containing protein [Stenotrophomonas sp. ATCM1_4]TDB28004.1 DUF998 domain-containing protein [Stenotrophomonas sp. ATCM1_4]